MAMSLLLGPTQLPHRWTRLRLKRLPRARTENNQQQRKANMSPIPLISHHLFVAAVKEKGCASRTPARNELAPVVQAREIAFELVVFVIQLRLQAVSPFNAFPLTGSASEWNLD